jgi:hypothetical protein
MKGYGATSSSAPLRSVVGESAYSIVSNGPDAEDSKPAPSSAPPMSIPRDTFIYILNRRAERAVNCRYVPIAIITYVVACYLIILHGHVPASSVIASALLDQVVAAGGIDFRQYIQTRNSWVDYYAGPGVSAGNEPPANQGWIANVLPQYDDGVVIKALNRRGRVAGTNLILGGVHLSQLRKSARDCTLLSIRTVYGDCTNGPRTNERFGPSNVGSPKYNVTLPGINFYTNIQSAFNATDDRDGGGKSFQYVLSSAALPIDNQAILKGLDSAGWIDEFTDSVTVETVYLNGEEGYVARLAMTTDFTAGGKAENFFRLSVFPADFYGLYPQLLALDTLAVFFFVYIALALAQRTGRDWKRGRPWSHICSFWRLSDLGAVICLFVAIVQFGQVNRDVKSLGIDPSLAARFYQDGSSSISAAVVVAASHYDTFKNTLVWLLGFLTIRVFYYFTFQPRLASLIIAFSGIAVDLFHYGIVLGAALAFLGVWGHFYFGTVAPDWSSVRKSFMAVMRMVVYDYDLKAMEAVR